MSSELNDIINKPVFIIGCPRSGTTWLQRLLLGHPDICGGQETHFFSTFGNILRVYNKQKSSQRRVGLACYWEDASLKATLTDLWHNTVTGLVKSKPNAKILLEKTPAHARYMDVILELFPDARFIHIIRDSRAVVSSLLAASQSEWGDWAPSTAKQAAVQWYLHVKDAREGGQKLGPSQYIEVRYEDLKSDGFNQLTRLFNFLNISISTEQLTQLLNEQDFDKQSQSGGSQLVAGIDTGLTNKEPSGFFRKGEADSWRHDLTFIDKCVVWRFTRKLMYACGYSMEW